jgi:hypothetical protein
MERMVFGEVVPFSAEYDIVNENGTVVGSLYLKSGTLFPPTQCPTDYYELSY